MYVKLKLLLLHTRVCVLRGKAKFPHAAYLQNEGGFLMLHLFMLCSAHFVTLAISLAFRCSLSLRRTLLLHTRRTNTHT